jgi:predicted methyltransferase
MNPYLRLACTAFAMLLFAIPASGQTVDPALKALIDGPQRSEKNRARDPYRHPAEALTFFGVTPHSVVVEILPGAGGYWTEILAPYLKAEGRYIAANGEKASTSEETRKDNAGFEAKLAADPAGYGKVEITEFAADRHEIAPAGSADFVLTFRNVHNWMAHGETAAAFRTFYAALKPGGVLGVEEHRARDDQPQDPLAKSGYVRQDVAVQLRRSRGLQIRRELGDQRQSEGYERLFRWRLGAAADLSAERSGSRQIRRDRRERPVHAEIREAGALSD